MVSTLHSDSDDCAASDLSTSSHLIPPRAGHVWRLHDVLDPVVLHRSPSALGLTVPTLIAAFFRFVFSDLRRRRRGSVSTMTGTSVTETKGKTKPLQLFLPPARRWSPCFERRCTSSFHIQTIHTKAAQKKRDTLTSRHTMFHLHQKLEGHQQAKLNRTRQSHHIPPLSQPVHGESGPLVAATQQPGLMQFLAQHVAQSHPRTFPSFQEDWS